ncbi:SCO family protein [Poseidonocella sedimentorum]|uniref:Protein SCO1/2 n=1 Tax=Poseidonocella sedimentorum TaxID=871652 RepID=A0A1I6D7E4_9RHOB|nr:SCO family protein [Poseidonocella sedimentorum]SFR01232.1 protein SCO1/2 [Poseidonocella sedimentorum]
MRTLIAGAAAAALAALIGGFWFATRSGPETAFDACRGGSVAGGDAIGGPITLVSETGETVTDQDIFTAPTLVYFGYTYCPDVCPYDAARNAEAVDLLAEMGHEVKSVFITIDPERDTPEVLQEFTDYMHEDMIGLTGSPAQIDAAAKAYKTYYEKQDSEDEFYLVDHMTFTYLMMPGGAFADFFRRDVTADDMATRAACFIEAAS